MLLKFNGSYSCCSVCGFSWDYGFIYHNFERENLKRQIICDNFQHHHFTIELMKTGMASSNGYLITLDFLLSSLNADKLIFGARCCVNKNILLIASCHFNYIDGEEKPAASSALRVHRSIDDVLRHDATVPTDRALGSDRGRRPRSERMAPA